MRRSIHKSEAEFNAPSVDMTFCNSICLPKYDVVISVEVLPCNSGDIYELNMETEQCVNESQTLT